MCDRERVCVTTCNNEVLEGVQIPSLCLASPRHSGQTLKKKVKEEVRWPK